MSTQRDLDLLEATTAAFKGDETFVNSMVLIQRLMEENPTSWWRGEWINGKAASMSLSTILSQFSVQSVRQTIDKKQQWGYTQASVANALNKETGKEVTVIESFWWN